MTTFPIDEIERCDARKACNRKAEFIVSIHIINDCKSWLENVPGAIRIVNGKGLTPWGDTVWLMCPADRDFVTRRLGVIVGEMYSDIPDDDVDEHTVPTCATCGRRIVGVDDVMTVEDLA